MKPLFKIAIIALLVLSSCKKETCEPITVIIHDTIPSEPEQVQRNIKYWFNVYKIKTVSESWSKANVGYLQESNGVVTHVLTQIDQPSILQITSFGDVIKTTQDSIYVWDKEDLLIAYSRDSLDEYNEVWRRNEYNEAGTTVVKEHEIFIVVERKSFQSL